MDFDDIGKFKKVVVVFDEVMVIVFVDVVDVIGVGIVIKVEVKLGMCSFYVLFMIFMM